MGNDVVGCLVLIGLGIVMVSLVAQAVESSRKNRVLEQFATEVGGTVVGHGKAEVRHRSWLITVNLETETETTNHDDMTTTTRNYTRVRAPYFATDNFQFKIYPKGCFSRLGIFLGMQDVDVGDPSFDSLFVVQGSDEQKLHQLFENPAIREVMRREPTVSLTRKVDSGWFFRKLPKDMDELYFEVGEHVVDVGRLKLLTVLAKEVLEELVFIGSASESRPGPEV